MLIAKAMIEIPFKNVDFEFYKNLHKYVFLEIFMNGRVQFVR